MKPNRNHVSFDTVVYSEGLPCHKFILKSLSTINDAKVFTKNYVTTMKTAGMADAEIESSLLFFSGIAHGLEGKYDFASWYAHIEGFSLLDDILFDNMVATYKTCRQYYRKLDTKCSACVLCPLSSNYKNANIEAERNVVLYALSSRENLEYVLSKGVTAEHFISVTDITSRKAVSLKPCLYPFYKHTMAALTDPAVRDDIYMFENDYEPVLEQYHSKKVARLSSIEKDCSFSVNTFCAVMIGDMLYGEPCTREKVDVYIKTFFPEINSSLSEVMSSNTPSFDDALCTGDSCNLGERYIQPYRDASAVVKSSNKGKCKSSSAPSKDRAVSNKSKISEPEFVAVTLDSIMAGIEGKVTDGGEPVLENGYFEPISVQTDIPVSLDNVSTGSAMEDTDDVSSVVVSDVVVTSDDELPVEDVVSQIHNEVLCCYTPMGDNIVVPYHSYAKSSFSTADILSDRITEIEMPEELLMLQSGDMVGIPIISAAELSHFALNLDAGNPHLLSLFESHTYKDKRLSLEIVSVSDTDFYLLLYSPKLHAYFYTKCRAVEVLEILSPILSHQSIQKFCYYPYVLLSVFRKMGIRIKGLYSLFSMSRTCLGSHSMSMSMTLVEMGATKAVGGVTIHAEGDMQSVALLYMHCYHNLYYRNKRYLVKRGMWNEYESANTYDIVLGLSYYQNIYSDDMDFLFKLSHANGYLFRSKANEQYRYPGKRLCFSLRYVPGASGSFIMKLLCMMYEKGLFFHADIMLLSMSHDFFSLYIMEKDLEYVETKINRMILSLLHKSNLRGADYFVSELKGTDLYKDD